MPIPKPRPGENSIINNNNNNNNNNNIKSGTEFHNIG